MAPSTAPAPDTSDSNNSPPANNSDNPSPPPPSDDDSSRSSSPPPSSPPPSSPPPSSPPPSSPPPSSPPPSSPPPSSSSPPSSPPPSSPPPSSPSPPPPSKSSPLPPSSNSSSSDHHTSGSSSSNSYKSTTKSPPPPPYQALAPPPPTSSTSSDSTSSAIMEKLPLIIGVSVGVAVLLFIMMICFCCLPKRKRKREEMHYYSPTNNNGRYQGPGGEYYHNSTQQANWHQPQMAQNHVVQLPQQQSNTSGWAAPPPPPPGMMSSGEVSSQYSGPHHPPLPPPSPHVALGYNQSSFTYDDLAAATGGFAQANMIGQGGFGYVHKGVLPNGKEIAVKSLKAGSGQGEREFQAEVDIISRVHHRHLVSLVGYCIAGGQRMLAYEFVPNKTLEYHLHGKDQPTMDFATRLRIALGSAKGLAYLHEDCHPKIIHRDIKAANILLDFNFEAMVADFGLAKLSSDNYTHVSTRVMGTFGYLAPEYAASGKLSEKSDVFSFGVMLLELVTGKRPCDNTNDDSLVDWARPMLQSAIEEEIFQGLVDPFLENNYNSNEMARLVACAAACIRHSARKRPKMSQIARALEGDVSLEDLNEGVKPGQSSNFGSSSDYDTATYNSDMKKFKKMALSSQEFTSGEFNGDGMSSSSGEMSVRKPPRAY